jgi:hypothetical protein
VLGEYSGQEELFRLYGVMMIKKALEGINSTV